MTSPAFDAGRPMELHPEVALRDERFGALAYHYGNRRLVFLKSPALVELVTVLSQHASAADAISATVPDGEAVAYEAALANLERSEVVRVR